MSVSIASPFVLSLSKDVSAAHMGFDRLSPNGFGSTGL